MAITFLLWHVHEIEPGNEDEKLIGAYQTEDEAKPAIDTSKINPDFWTFQTGFRFVPVN